MPRRSLTGSWPVTSSAVDLDRAGGRLDQPVDHLQRRRLAAAGRADQAPPARRASTSRSSSCDRHRAVRRRSCRRPTAGSSRRRARARGGSVHAVTLLVGRWRRRPTAELLQPARQRVVLLRSTSQDRQDEIVDATVQHLADHGRRGAARPRDRLPARPARAPPAAAGVDDPRRQHRHLHDPVAGAAAAAGAVHRAVARPRWSSGSALYALTILVRAMLEGFRAVPDDVVESATGLGYGADPAALQDRAAARAAGDDGRPAGGHRVDGRADHRRHARGVRRPGQPDHATACSTNFRAELVTAAVLCVLLARAARRRARRCRSGC